MSLPSPQIAFEDSKPQMPSSLLCLFSPAELSNWAGSPSGISTPPQPLILSFFWPACSKYVLCSPVDPHFLCIESREAHNAHRNLSLWWCECPNASGYMQMYLGAQHQGCGERKIYLPIEREEGNADIMQKPFTHTTVYILLWEGIKLTCKYL